MNSKKWVSRDEVVTYVDDAGVAGGFAVTNFPDNVAVASRVALCLNACHGIPDSALSGIDGGIPFSVSDQIESAMTTAKLRRELASLKKS